MHALTASSIFRLPNPRFLVNVAIPSVQRFLLFLFLRGVLFKNLNDATLSSLGNPSNMQFKAAITETLSFVNISVTVYQSNFCVYPLVLKGKE